MFVNSKYLINGKWGKDLGFILYFKRLVLIWVFVICDSFLFMFFVFSGYVIRDEVYLIELLLEFFIIVFVDFIFSGWF